MIVVRYIDMPYDVPVYSVDSYRFVFIPRNGLTVKKKITGNKISDDEKEILKKALEGDKIIISEIKISSPNEKSILLKDKIELVVN